MTHSILLCSRHFSNIYQLMFLMKTDTNLVKKFLEKPMKLLLKIRNTQSDPKYICFPEGAFANEFCWRVKIEPCKVSYVSFLFFFNIFDFLNTKLKKKLLQGLTQHLLPFTIPNQIESGKAVLKLWVGTHKVGRQSISSG